MKIKEMDMEKKVSIQTYLNKEIRSNIYELVRLLEKIEREELTTTQLNELNDKVEELNEWLYRNIFFPSRIFF